MQNKYSSVFSGTINKKTIAGTPMKIHLRDDIEITPQKCYVARATPVNQQAAATKLEQELEAAGIIQKVNKPTAWTSPGFFVPKPNGGVRLVTDYAGPRGLNSQILRGQRTRSPQPMTSCKQSRHHQDTLPPPIASTAIFNSLSTRKAGTSQRSCCR
jgi:hypothetical protein